MRASGLFLVVALAGLATWASAAPVRSSAGADWPVVHGEPGGTRYSRLDQINRKNVGKLEVAWTYRTGDADPPKLTNIECTPIVVDGVMYVTTCSPKVKVDALDAATGSRLWRYDPWVSGPRNPNIASGGVNRGVAYWTDGKDRRIFLGTADGRLIALEAASGKPVPGFAKDGVLDLRAGLEGDTSRLSYGMTSPPAVIDNLVVIGMSNGEGPRPGAPGDVRAFDTRSGKEVWRFHTVPRPGEFGHEDWADDAWQQRGGCNAWSGYTVDVKRKIVFAGLGCASFDFYGGDRPGRNLFGNCVLALDARTGKRLWHYQTVRHDIWDYDNPTPPVLCTVRQNGKTRDAVAQLTKTGFCFVLDRETGKPLFPVEERPAPKSDVAGEVTWPTQLFPLKPPPLCRQSFGPEDATDIAPANHEFVLNRLKNMRYGPIFTPGTPAMPTVRLPGLFGGASWSGSSFDPTTNILYVNANDIPREHTLGKNPRSASKLPYDTSGIGRFVDQEGYPALKPPWGHLIAIDLNKGEFAWKKVLGEYPKLTKRGIPPTGTESLGGTIVTAGGLVFIGGTKDEMFRAFDKATGQVLWQHPLPAGGYATPCTYSVNGRQYVCIAAAGGGKLATPSGDSYVAFALPRR